jgi:hypothetical protein
MGVARRARPDEVTLKSTNRPHPEHNVLPHVSQRGLARERDALILLT